MRSRACEIDVWWLRVVCTDGRVVRLRAPMDFRTRFPFKIVIPARTRPFTVVRLEYLDRDDTVLFTWYRKDRTETPVGGVFTLTTYSLDCTCCGDDYAY